MGIRYPIRMENVRRGIRIGIVVIGRVRGRGVGRVLRGRDVSCCYFSIFIAYNVMGEVHLGGLSRFIKAVYIVVLR